MVWELWWAWMCLALGLGVLEVLIPGYVFLGFAIGAGALSLLMLVFLSAGLPVLLAIFAALSVLAWVALRLIFGSPGSRARVVRDDINK